MKGISNKWYSGLTIVILKIKTIQKAKKNNTFLKTAKNNKLTVKKIIKSQGGGVSPQPNVRKGGGTWKDLNF